MLFVLIFIALFHDISNNVQRTNLQPITVQKEQTEQKQQNTETAVRQETTNGLAMRSQEEQSTATHGDAQNSYDPGKDALYRRYLRGTIVGVIGGLIGLAILIWQTILVRKSANAARRSADAVISAERAWIFVDLFFPGGNNMAVGNGSTGVFITVCCRNVGKAPAWITEIRVKFILLKFEEQLPQEPIFDLDDVIHIEPKPLEPDPSKQFCSSQVWLHSKGEYIATAGKHRPIVYGIVKYRDPFGNSRFTTFGFRILPGTGPQRLQRIPDPKYNHTE